MTTTYKPFCEPGPFYESIPTLKFEGYWQKVQETDWLNEYLRISEIVDKFIVKTGSNKVFAYISLGRMDDTLTRYALVDRDVYFKAIDLGVIPYADM